MDQMLEDDLKTLGLAIGREVAGYDAVEKVAVETILDSQERVAYYFSFLINQAKLTERLGQIRTTLGLKIHDELIARGDAHRPLLRMLDHADWAKLYHA